MKKLQEDPLIVALEKLGEGSTLLWMVFILSLSPTIFTGMQSMSYLFIAEVPEHWCAVPELQVANWTEEQIKNVSYVDSCTMNKYDYEHFAAIGFNQSVNYINGHNSTGTETCPAHSFTTDFSSLVEEWDLVCDRSAKRSTTHIVLSFGKLIGGYLCGIVADKYGRRLPYLIGIFLLFTSGPLSAIVPWYWGFLILRIFTGISLSAIQFPSFTTLTEIASDRKRQWMGTVYNCGYATGVILVSAISLVIFEWRMIQLAVTLPSLVLLFHAWFMPESPRWLISQGRREEARVIIERFYGPISTSDNNYHNSTLDNQPAAAHSTGDGKELELEVGSQESVKGKGHSLKDDFKGLSLIFGNAELRNRAIIGYFLWMTVALSYYGLALNVDNFSANHNVYAFLLGTTEIIAYSVPSIILKVMGRRTSCSILYFISAIFLMTILLIPKQHTTLLIVMGLIGRSTIAAVFSVVTVFTCELFPTVTRNSAVGSSAAMSHVGSMAAPLVADLLGATAWWAPTTVFGMMSLLASMLILLLPETRGRPISDTVEQELNSSTHRTTIFGTCCRS